METTDTNLPYTNTDLHSLVINELTKAQYNELATQGLINENELYIVTDAEAVKVKEGGALVGDGTPDNPLDISDEFKTQLSGNIEALNKEVQNLKDTKQDNLTAGTNIEIVDNTVSTIATQVIRRKW